MGSLWWILKPKLRLQLGIQELSNHFWSLAVPVVAFSMGIVWTSLLPLACFWNLQCENVIGCPNWNPLAFATPSLIIQTSVRLSSVFSRNWGVLVFLFSSSVFFVAFLYDSVFCPCLLQSCCLQLSGCRLWTYGTAWDAFQRFNKPTG